MYFQKQVFLPQDHGAWVFIFSPLLIGLFAGRAFTLSSLILVVAAVTAFLIRQPITILVKVFSGRRPKEELPIAIFWIVIYGITMLTAITGLIMGGYTSLLYIAAPGSLIFMWHLWLVSNRRERRQVNIEVIAIGVLSLAAPAAYWVGIGYFDQTGWWLWLLVWTQSAASIVYAYLRLEQREWKSVPDRWTRFRAGFRAYLYTSFNLLITIILGAVTEFLPALIFIPFLLQWGEVLWGIEHPSVGWKPVRIGIRQLIVSSLWTVLFIFFWR